MPSAAPALRRLFWAAVLLAAVSLALHFTFASVHYRWNWSGAWNYREQFLRGWLTTLLISAGAMVISIAEPSCLNCRDSPA